MQILTPKEPHSEGVSSLLPCRSGRNQSGDIEGVGNTSSCKEDSGEESVSKDSGDDGAGGEGEGSGVGCFVRDLVVALAEEPTRE